VYVDDEDLEISRSHLCF